MPEPDQRSALTTRGRCVDALKRLRRAHDGDLPLEHVGVVHQAGTEPFYGIPGKLCAPRAAVSRACTPLCNRAPRDCVARLGDTRRSEGPATCATTQSAAKRQTQTSRAFQLLAQQQHRLLAHSPARVPRGASRCCAGCAPRHVLDAHRGV